MPADGIPWDSVAGNWYIRSSCHMCSSKCLFRDPSTLSEGDWRHCYVGLEGPSTFGEGTTGYLGSCLRSLFSFSSFKHRVLVDYEGTIISTKSSEHVLAIMSLVQHAEKDVNTNDMNIHILREVGAGMPQETFCWICWHDAPIAPDCRYGIVSRVIFHTC